MIITATTPPMIAFLYLTRNASDCVSASSIIHRLIIRLAKVVFLYLQTKFRGIFFCFTLENLEKLATFVNKLTRIQ